MRSNVSRYHTFIKLLVFGTMCRGLTHSDSETRSISSLNIDMNSGFANLFLSAVNQSGFRYLRGLLVAQWTLPFFAKGLKKIINEDDLYGPLKEHESKILGDKLEEAWLREFANRENPSLLKALIRVFGKETMLFALVVLFQELIVKMAHPILLGKFMSYFVTNQKEVSIEQAYLYASLIVLATFMNVFLVHLRMLGVMHLGMKIRIACCSMIYRKALRLSKSALAEASVGQMVNLLSNDVSRFEETCIHIHHLWIGPLQAVIIVYLLYTTVHPAALAGTAILLAFIPLQVFLGKKSSHYRLRTALKTDQRVRLMNEIISGIEVIKMYTWEKPFAKLVEKSRQLEIREIKAASYIRAINASFMMFLSRTSVFLCILVYFLTGNQVQAQYVFVVTSYYGILRQTLTMWLPSAVTQLSESNVSVNRIQKYLMKEEVNPHPRAITTNGIQNEKWAKFENYNDVTLVNPHNVGVSISHGSAKWLASSENYNLMDINFSAGHKQLVSIIGTVGSGKTTLLHLILKEIPLLKGELTVEGRISYASQEPWLFAGSIRQNITFGQPIDLNKYKQVVRACALERDFSSFPHGDRTLVGERGVTLSGGQRARVNLARAIYKDADIYLLDDPLSAVDTHVGKKLFDDCIQKYLKDKCVILVTHQLQYLRSVEKIYLMENGRITASGSYEEIQTSASDFVRMLRTEKGKIDHEDTGIREKVPSRDDVYNLSAPAESKENRGSGTVSTAVYKSWIKAGGNPFFSFAVISLFFLAQLGGSGTDLFLSFWVNLEQDRATKNTTEEANFVNNTDTSQDFLEFNFFTSVNCLYIYSVLVSFIVVITVTRSLSFLNFCMAVSRNLHNTMFSKIVYAPMRFFDTNPSGRILNRFSKDVGSIDEALPMAVIDTLQVGLMVISIVLVVSTVNAWILIPTAIIFGLFYCYRIVFLATSRNLKRIEATTRSPVFTHLSASLQGLITIRAFKAEKILTVEFDQHQDLHTSADYMYIACSRTFSFWLDVNCVLYIALVTFSFLFIGGETYGGNVGLAITRSTNLIGMLQWGMRQWSALENQMTSVERVLEYTQVTPEQDDSTKIPAIRWPVEGKIQFNDVCFRYAPDEPVVLEHLNFVIRAREKVGVVGRTGAGKSSLISAIFRLAPVEGHIYIDDVDTKEVSLSSLRSKISIIPQEPVLFSGTLRRNLDPFDEYSDSELWNALEEVEMRSSISDLSAGLQSIVAENGSNFSVGQRQLLCLARAVIRDNKILVLDEATANVDPQTDELIQKTIRRKFKNCTVLTIAHRLHTVMDSDKILVMEAGKAVEFDHPYLLVQNPGSVFYGLVKQTGKGVAENLRRVAEETPVLEEMQSSPKPSTVEPPKVSRRLLGRWKFESHVELMN